MAPWRPVEDVLSASVRPPGTAPQVPAAGLLTCSEVICSGKKEKGIHSRNDKAPVSPRRFVLNSAHGSDGTLDFTPILQAVVLSSKREERTMCCNNNSPHPKLTR